MPLTRYKTFVDGQTLTAADLNGMQDQVIDNEQAIGTPREADFDMNGERLILSEDGNTSVAATAGKVDFRLASQDLVDLDGTAASPVNGFSLVASATGVAPRVQAKGSDANVGAVLAGKGTGAAVLRSNGADVVTASAPSSAVNGITVTAAATGNSPAVAATGSDTDVNVLLTPKGTGVVRTAAGYGVDGATALTWRLAGSGTSLVLQENTGTPSAPTWTTRVDFQTGTSGTFPSGGSIAVPDPHNQLDNGALQIWQDGATSGDPVSATPTYPDRWFVHAGLVSGVFNVSRQDLFSSGFRYLHRIQRVAGQTSTQTTFFYQAIPSAMSAALAGQTVTLSFYARAGANYSAASSALVSRIYTGTGTDQGSGAMIGAFAGPWAGAVNSDQSNTLTTSLQRFSHTFAIPSTAREVGIAIMATGVGTAGAADYYEVTGLLMQLGAAAGTYPHQTFQAELAQCQRFYCKTFPYGTRPAAAAGYAGTIVIGRASANLEPYARWQFPVEMLGSPSITRYNPGAAGTAAAWRNNGDSASASATQTLHITPVAVIFANTGIAESGASSWHLHASASLAF